MSDVSRPSRPCAWVTGAAGLIGTQLVRMGAAAFPGHRMVALTRAELELTDFAAVAQRFERERPEIIVHSAALSRGPQCQADPLLARLLNVEVTRHLASLSEKAHFIFLSTDLVFDGRRGGYREEDPVNPLSVYAATKVEAEAVVQAHPKHLILRTSLTYGHTANADRSFNEEMVLAWKAGRTLPLFTDEFRCPIAAAVTARAVWELAGGQATGLYHLAGSERLSRWEIGQLVAARNPAASPRIEPGSLKSFAGAPRPPDVSLDCSRVQERLSFPLPRFSQWMAENEPVA